MLNKSVKIIKTKNEKLNITNWRAEIEQMNTVGINKMSLAEITGIPRPTVSRKVNKLLNKSLARIDKYKLIHPETTVFKKDITNIHNNSVSSFSKFSATIWNLLIFK